MNDSIPKSISKYRIDGVLGQGAMGLVYFGFDESIERKVAIKTISISSKCETQKDEYRQRFEQEAKALAKCTHPNIVTILEFGHADNMAYMVLEYISGSNLNDIINQPKGMGLMQVMSYFTQLLKALHAAHSSNIIHRDIKPENVLLVKNKIIKLTDFGIAKSHLDDNLTQIGITMGTPRYMAPEQLFGTDEIGPYTDIYCLFVMLFEMLGTVRNRENYDFTRLKTLPQMAKHNKLNSNTMIPACMIDFIDKGLKTSYLDRYQTVVEVVNDLKSILQTLKNLRTNTSHSTGQNNSQKQHASIISGNNFELDFELDSEQFESLRQDLSHIIGAMSDFIITDAMGKSRNYDQFVMHIAQSIEHNTLREEFVDKWRKF